MTLPDLYTLTDVADALGMSERWLRQKCADGASYTRLGNKIRFTEAQYQALVETHSVTPVAQSITTGRGRRRAS